MDKASDFESEDCEFESRRGRNVRFSSSYSASKIQLVNLFSEAQWVFWFPTIEIRLLFCQLLLNFRFYISNTLLSCERVFGRKAEEKLTFPHRESNPGRLGESQES